MNHAEIIAGPLTVWIAPVGTPFPLIADAPAEPWTLLGANGAKSYADGGVSVLHRTDYEISRPASLDAVPSNAFVASDELRIAVELIDVRLETYAVALSQAPVTTTARDLGTAGFRSIGLAQPVRRNARLALLARGPSPYANGMLAQYELPVCRQIGSPAPLFSRGQPVGLSCEFIALRNPAATSEDEIFGRLIAQDSERLRALLRDEDGAPLVTSSGQFLEI